MATITIDGLQIDDVISWETIEETSVSTPSWINVSNPSDLVDENVWSRSVERITFLCRLNDDDKWTLEQSANGMSTVTLDDRGTEMTVWIARITSKYDAKNNWSKPWLVEVELIVVP